MSRGRRAAGRLAVALGTLVTLVVAVPNTALAWDSLRHDKCIVRAHAYAADDHPSITPQEAQARSDWLYEQCAENDAVEAFAEEQGSMASELFPNKDHDRHAHPLHCMSLRDNRFGMHTNHNSANPPPDPNGPGGAAAMNIPGEFMYAFINGKARFMMRFVVWTIDDRDGNPVTPVKVNQHPTYMGTPQVTVAVLNFSEAYQPVSIWVEMPDNMAVANIENSGLLPGRRLTSRTWMESKCHDKRDPTVIPHMLIDHMQNLGWLDDNATAQSARAVRFVASGDPNQASSWALSEVPVELPPSSQIFTKNSYKWFHDSGVIYNGEDTLGPTLTVDHNPGNTFPGPDVTLSGEAVDSTAVDSVSVTIENSAGQYLQNNGSFGTNQTELATTLGSPGATSTSWSISATLPVDYYDLEVIGSDSLGNTSVLSNADFEVNPNGPDTEVPLVDMDHAINTQFVGPSVTIRGTASDNVGVTDVEVEIKDRVSKQFLQPDGSFGARVRLPATLTSQGSTSSTWSITVNLPAGGYNIESFAHDSAGNEGDNPTWKKFDVVDGQADGIDPTAFADHSDGAQFTAPNVALSGSASDNVGVASVVATIANGSGDYLQGDGGFGPSPFELNATLGSPGSDSTTWQLNVALPTDGYDLEIYARDAAGNEGVAPNADFVVTDGADVIAPTANVAHAKDTIFTGPAVTIDGVAADNIGVVAAAMKVKNRDTGLWLQPDGSFAPRVAWLSANVAGAGSTDVTLSISLTLPNGRYNPVVRAFDAAGNEGTQTAFRPFEVVGGGASDTSAPTTNFDHARNTVFAGPTVTLTGFANDNIGVVSVVVKIKDRDTGKWLQPNGTFANGVFWHDAQLDDPGAANAAWSIEFDLPDGRYNPVSRAYDSAGNEGTQTAFRPIEIV